MNYTARKMSKYGVFSGAYFPAFGLNTERYGFSLRIQSKCGKIRTRKNSVFGLFLRSVKLSKKFYLNYEIIAISNEKFVLTNLHIT